MSDATNADDVTPADPTPADVAREEPPVEAHELVEPVDRVEPDAATDRAELVEPVEPAPYASSSQPAPPTVPPVEAGHTGPVAPVDTEPPAAAYDTPAAAPAPVATTPVAPATSPAPAPSPAPNIVYVSAPVPPRPRGNRLVGTLLAVLGAALFAAVYAAAYAAATILSGSPVAPIFTAFVASALFWVPVLVFLVAFVLLVLVLNRAGWWAHVLGSLIVALVVYFGSAGILLLVSGLPAFAGESGGLPLSYFLGLPGVILAGIVAREVSIWVGLGIAARGRRLTVKNREARAEFEREQAERRAEHERSTSQA